jgi:hypothetical protein
VEGREAGFLVGRAAIRVELVKVPWLEALTVEKTVVYDAPVDVGSGKRVRCKEAGLWEMH